MIRVFSLSGAQAIDAMAAQWRRYEGLERACPAEAGRASSATIIILRDGRRQKRGLRLTWGLLYGKGVARPDQQRSHAKGVGAISRDAREQISPGLVRAGGSDMPGSALARIAEATSSRLAVSWFPQLPSLIPRSPATPVSRTENVSPGREKGTLAAAIMRFTFLTT